MALAAIGLALAAFVLVSLDSDPLSVSADFGAPSLLSSSGIDISFANGDYWPVEYRSMHAVVWAHLFGVVTMYSIISVVLRGRSVGGENLLVAVFIDYSY
ncbi:hypothetical protein GCM10009006_34560 [Haloarcula argentinensis]|uniref:Uncharacterized protein n=1 Tax=Haloarcula argentinensis TaxID=43776 RepID=A0A830FRM9_HALAR|nr:hypothetical protein GCM10009006_34560 [Haloarcula argentinensis]